MKYYMGHRPVSGVCISESGKTFLATESILMFVTWNSSRDPGSSLGGKNTLRPGQSLGGKELVNGRDDGISPIVAGV
jgi:hypothetical protein